MKILRANRTPSAWIARALLIVAGALLALSATSISPAAAEPEATLNFNEPNGSGDVAAEGDDFFTARLADPVDFNNPADVTNPLGWSSQGIANGRWSGVGSIGDANFFLLFPGFDIAANGVDSRNGQVYQVDPNRYNHLVFKYTASASTNAVLYWMSPGDPYRRTIGNSDIYGLQAGTHIVDMDLNKRAGGGGSGAVWTAEQWGGLRFSPSFGTPGVSVSVDWVRLVPGAGGGTVASSWSCSSCNGSLSFYADLDNNPNNGGMVLLAGGVSATAGQFAAPVNKLAPGNYYLVAQGGNVGTAYSPGTFNVREAPILELTAPSTSSGEDYATSVLGRPWDMTNPAAIAGVANVTGFTVGGGVAEGRAINGDPAVLLLNGNGPAIDTSRFKYLSYSLFLPRPRSSQFDLSRVFWYDRPQSANVTGDIINWYDYWQSYSIDLTRVNMSSSPTGWTGLKPVFRIDPHEEDPAYGLPAYFRLGPVRLTGDPTVRQGQATSVTWNILRGTGTVALSYRPVGSAGGWTEFASGVPISSGSYGWNTGNVGPGSYMVRAVASDGVNNIEWLSNAPLVVTPGNGSPFSDVNPNDYFYESALYLTSQGVISGYADGHFRPFNNATRGQTTKIIVLAEGFDLANPATVSFQDVPADNPFHIYIETAVARGIVNGYADRTFRPNNNVTRGQLAKMVVVAADWALVNPVAASFNDVPRGSTFYEFVETAYSREIISGYSDRTFRPGNNAVRGQLSKIVYQAITEANAVSGAEQPSAADSAQPAEEPVASPQEDAGGEVTPSDKVIPTQEPTVFPTK